MEQKLRFGLDLGQMAIFPEFILQNLLVYGTTICLKNLSDKCGTYQKHIEFLENTENFL